MRILEEAKGKSERDFRYTHQLATRRAGHNLIAKMKEMSLNWILEIVEMEKHTDYTCDPEYASEWNRLMTKQNAFIERILDNEKRSINMRIAAYWNVVLRRLVDSMALHLQLNVANLVNHEIEMEIFNELTFP
ncbi:hypothetical protein ACFX1T_028346 [Malus domestica]